MFRNFRILTGTLALAWAAGFAQAQEPANFDELLKVLDEQSVDRSNWQSDISMNMAMGTLQMAYEGVTKNRGEQSRTEMLMTMRGQETTIITVTDAEGLQWTEMDRGGQKQIVRIDMKRLAEALGPEVMERASLGQGPGAPIDVTQEAHELLAQYAENFDMKYLGTADHPDGKVYLVEGKRSASDNELTGMAADLARAGMAIETLKISIGIEDGFPRAIEMYGAEHQPLLTVHYENLKLDPAFAPDTFTFTPPEGATVNDVTSMMEQRIRQQQQTP